MMPYRIAVAVPFTRDLDTIRNKLPLVEEGDRTCLETALAGVNQLALSEWGHQTLVQIVLVSRDQLSFVIQPVCCIWRDH